VRIRLPYPHPGQQHVLQTRKRFNWLSAGRRWRKTTLAMSICVDAAMRGKRILWGAPTHDQVKVGFDEARYACGGTGVRLVETPMPEATFPGGGKIVWRSLDKPDHARGHSADLIVVDETADVAERAWTEILRPMLMDTRGDAWFIGTPKGRNWFWRGWNACVDDGGDSARWQAPALGVEITPGGLVRAPHPLENPHVTFDEMVRLYEQMPLSKFRQEILAEFIEQEGQVFRNVAECMKGMLAAAVAGKLYVAGVDLARTTDYTVVAVMDAYGHVVAFDRMTGLSWGAQLDRVTRLVRQYNAITFVDKTGLGDPLFEQLANTGLTFQPFVFTHDTKRKLIEQLVMAFERQTISLPPELKVAADELLAFEARKSATGTTRYGAPDGMHDDCVMALALANYAAHLYGVPTQ